MTAIPNSKPKMTREDALKELASFGLDEYPVKVLGIRGYYKATMGNPLKNDINIYDDAFFIVTPDFFASFNGNTDPSKHQAGIATLIAPQVIFYKVGIHGISGSNPREAFRQASFGIKVTRVGKEGVFTDTPQAPFWANMHDGGINSTGSLACQTVPKSQWVSYRDTLKAQLKKHNQVKFPYVLIEYK